MTGESFGEVLRSARSRRHLTQAELGGERYSASYVSLLESGRRAPTPAVIAEFAERLGMAVNELAGAASHLSASEVEMAEAEVGARMAWQLHDYPRALELARRATELARATNPHSGWGPGYLVAQCLLATGDYENCYRRCQELVEHPMGTASPELATRATSLSAAAMQGLGRLEEAVVAGRLAVAHSRDLEAGSPERLEAVMALVAALAERGDLDEAARASADLRVEPVSRVSAHTMGAAAWTLGNIAFLRGDAQTGAREHDRASTCLSPEIDLRLWGRFHKATVAMRLAAGLSTPDMAQHLDRARQALSLVGNNSDILELHLTTAGWEASQGNPTVALQELEPLIASGQALPGQTLGEAFALQSAALQALDRQAEADAALDNAVAQYERAGAYQRALELVRGKSSRTG